MMIVYRGPAFSTRTQDLDLLMRSESFSRKMSDIYERTCLKAYCDKVDTAHSCLVKNEEDLTPEDKLLITWYQEIIQKGGPHRHTYQRLQTLRFVEEISVCAREISELSDCFARILEKGLEKTVGIPVGSKKTRAEFERGLEQFRKLSAYMGFLSKVHKRDLATLIHQHDPRVFSCYLEFVAEFKKNLADIKTLFSDRTYRPLLAGAWLNPLGAKVLREFLAPLQDGAPDLICSDVEKTFSLLDQRWRFGDKDCLVSIHSASRLVERLKAPNLSEKIREILTRGKVDKEERSSPDLDGKKLTIISGYDSLVVGCFRMADPYSIITYFPVAPAHAAAPAAAAVAQQKRRETKAERTAKLAPKDPEKAAADKAAQIARRAAKREAAAAGK